MGEGMSQPRQVKPILCAVPWCAAYAVTGKPICAAHVFWKGDITEISNASRPEQPDLEGTGAGAKYFRIVLGYAVGARRPWRQAETDRKSQAGEAKGAKADCKCCHGSGECPHCDGDGQMQCECTCGDNHERECSECDGSGDCPRCFS
jgi:hypothetical protein